MCQLLDILEAKIWKFLKKNKINKDWVWRKLFKNTFLKVCPAILNFKKFHKQKLKISQSNKQTQIQQVV